jgi:two-component system cell cycle sensor histidine kinase PleC
MARENAAFDPLRGPNSMGPAMVLMSPPYLRLLQIEPRLRRAVPPLIVVFLSALALAGFVQMRDLRSAAIEGARSDLQLVAALVASRAERDPAADLSALLDAVPGQSGREGLTLLTLAGDGAILSGLGDARLLSARERLAWVHARIAPDRLVRTADGETFIAAEAKVSGQSLLVVRPTEAALTSWRVEVSTLAFFLATAGGMLLLVGFAFHWQAARANQADLIYADVRDRLEKALAHGRCGLWDWDMRQGRMYWSDSMFAMLGYAPSSELLSIRDLNGMIHPEDGRLEDIIESARASDGSSVDRHFRVRNSEGEWIWLRARGAIVGGGAKPTHLLGIAVDVTEEKAFEEQTRRADLRLRDAVEAISEAFVLWDANNRLVICNSKFQNLHKLPDELVEQGTEYRTIVAAGNQPVSRTQLAPESSSERGTRTYEAQLDDGRWLTISERRTKDGGYVSVGTDITSLKQQQEELVDGKRKLQATVDDLNRSRQALEQRTHELIELAERLAEQTRAAEAASRTKSAFLANMSHELRTPLNAILGFSELMSEEVFGRLGDERYAGYSRDIHESGRYLLEFVDDILELSTIEAGRRELHPERFGLDRLINDILRGAAGEISEKSLRLRTDMSEETEIEADRRAVRLIVRNLLSNAIKFTPADGAIGIRIRRTPGKLLIFVEDAGIGIPSDQMAKLGKPFEQVQTQFTKNHKGSGLGLSIAKSLAALHCGSLRIRSAIGMGTVVMVSLPIIARLQGEAVPRNPPETRATPPARLAGISSRDQLGITLEL